MAKALVNRGVCHGQAGRTAEAIADYTRAIDLPSAEPEIVEMARRNLQRVRGSAAQPAGESLASPQRPRRKKPRGQAGPPPS